MTIDDFTDAITIELQRRVQGDIAVPIEHCSCEHCDFVYSQQCSCDAEPDFDKWECSQCHTPYTKLRD